MSLYPLSLSGFSGSCLRFLLRLELLAEHEQLADGLFLDALVHGVEHLAAFLLVLHQRIALRHRAQADALHEELVEGSEYGSPGELSAEQLLMGNGGAVEGIQRIPQCV